ncbi:unnamed protein product [Paramecium sonneborni]|uniref:Uncharacterized protein n=1 Tax=Paramecium sonneborni TaxID=65129 RepID=A0A8S1QYB7_9CILI|nr:unnamed protein product [Paramecium sonneborni]
MSFEDKNRIKTALLINQSQIPWKFMESQYQINLTINGYIQYIRDGQIQKIEMKNDSSIIEMRNFEQIKNLRWDGQIGNKNKRIGRWRVFWGGERLNIGGYYNEMGNKQGIWIDLFENFWDKCEVIYEGEYKNDIKRGYWKTIYKVQQIGGGYYNQNELKHGKWIDLDENFNDIYQMSYEGEYNDGKKVGLWYVNNGGKIFGIGIYNQNGNKNGKWSKLQFQNLEFGQSIESGQYRNGLKIGNWNIIQNNTKIDGGQYDENGIKQGMWIELEKNEQNVGEYFDGKKVGMWDIIFRNSITGGGYYNEQGQKQGKWMELYENYNSYCQVIYIGDYENGIRNRKWKTIFDKKLIGEGCYNNQGMKCGLWVDLHENFDYFCQIVNVGKYENDQKYGEWKSIQCNINAMIGGGIYDENGMKNGYWIDLYENYQDECQIVFVGEYKNGFKFGKWKTKYKNQNKNEEIGGGSYENHGIKEGQWIDIHNNFNSYFQIIYVGQYNKGIKQGKWVIKYKQSDGYFFKTIGGGLYDHQGFKQGNWIEFQSTFQE